MAELAKAVDIGSQIPALRAGSEATAQIGLSPTNAIRCATATSKVGGSSLDEKLEDYCLLKTIGEGAFGRVFLVRVTAQPHRDRH
jgi:hypothetical protein